MTTKTNITRAQVNKLLDKVTKQYVSLSDLSEHELYILLRATFNELANMGCDHTGIQILRLNADCIIDE